MSRILLVEDDSVLSSRLAQWLEHERHAVQTSHNGDDAVSLLKLYQYDLIILDWEMPGRSGVEVCRAYRRMGGKTSVLMLTRKADISAKEEGLDAGADDYLPKPFHPREFSARVRALLRRQPEYSGNELRAGDIVLNKTAHKVSLRGQEIKVLPTEFALLEFLLKHPNQVFSKESLLELVWSNQSDASTEAVKTCIKSLRKKIDLDSNSSLIKSIRGVGYVFESKD